MIKLGVLVCAILLAPRFGDAAGAQTQLEMNQTAERALKAAETAMSNELGRLTKLAARKPSSVAKLQAAQLAWQAFRDAHIKAFWPSEVRGAYGSVHPMCVAQELTRLTNARVAELKQMTTSAQGDVCACQWPD